MKILLIEDNPTIAGQVGEFLAARQWSIDFADTGNLGIRLATEAIFDVVLLDLNLPDLDGLEVCRAIKYGAAVTPPILMLTARDRFDDKAAGFHHGADDYLTKPFDLRELMLRCEALARRSLLHQVQEIRVGELKLDLSTRSATRCDQPLQLTPIGFDLLTLLARHYPRPVARSLIVHSLWSDSPPDSNALKSHIYALRQALDKPFATAMLKTRANLGYQLETKESP